jgi:transcription antitermination factor NusG
MSSQWYAIRTETGRELSVAKELRPDKEVEVDEYLGRPDADIYLPICESLGVLPECGLTVKGTILPSYLFVRTDAVGRLISQIREIAERRGIWISIMRSPMNPLPVSDDAIKDMRYECEKLIRQTSETPDLDWMLGKTFKIQSGTWAGYEGPCWSFDKNNQPKIALPVCKVMTPVPIPLDCLCLTPVQEQTQHFVDSFRKKHYKSKQSTRRKSRNTLEVAL